MPPVQSYDNSTTANQSSTKWFSLDDNAIENNREYSTTNIFTDLQPTMAYQEDEGEEDGYYQTENNNGTDYSLDEEFESYQRYHPPQRVQFTNNFQPQYFPHPSVSRVKPTIPVSDEHQALEHKYFTENNENMHPNYPHGITNYYQQKPQQQLPPQQYFSNPEFSKPHASPETKGETKLYDLSTPVKFARVEELEEAVPDVATLEWADFLNREYGNLPSRHGKSIVFVSPKSHLLIFIL